MCITASKGVNSNLHTEMQQFWSTVIIYSFNTYTKIYVGQCQKIYVYQLGQIVHTIFTVKHRVKFTASGERRF